MLAHAAERRPLIRHPLIDIIYETQGGLGLHQNECVDCPTFGLSRDSVIVYPGVGQFPENISPNSRAISHPSQLSDAFDVGAMSSSDMRIQSPLGDPSPWSG